jgi:hypothetical protein
MTVINNSLIVGTPQMVYIYKGSSVNVAILKPGQSYEEDIPVWTGVFNYFNPTGAGSVRASEDF